MRTTIRLTLPTILLVLTTINLPGIGWAQDTASQSHESQWSVARLATGVEASIRRFETVELEMRYKEKRDINAFGQGDPILIDGEGSVHYRGDSVRWYLRDDGYTFRSGVAEAIPKTRISGFDGVIHYHGDEKRLTFAEEGSRRSATARGIIWEPILTYDYLSRALKNESAKIVFSGAEDGHEVVEMEATWGDKEHPWRLLVRFDVDRSFLPLWQKLDYDGKLYAESSIDEIRPVKADEQEISSGDGWYPRIVRTKFHQKALGVISRQSTFRRFDLYDELTDDAFRFTPPFGADVVDRRTNLAFHSDPWWDEMMPWVMNTLSFPRYAFQSLGDFRSICDPSIEGADAPPIDASAWIGEAPGSWDRKDRRFSVLFFWGEATGLHDPFPRWCTELAQFAQLVEPFGGEVIGIASDRTEIQAFRDTANELMMKIPFAIDAQSDGDGATHDAFKLKHYFSVVVVDANAKVRLLGDGDKSLMSVIGETIPKEDLAAIQSVIDIDAAMSTKEHDAIKSHWIRLRRQTRGAGKITGRVEPAKGARVNLLPQMKMLIASNPGGYMLFQDHQGAMSADPDRQTGTFEFTNLPHGVYQLSVVREEGEPEQTQVVLGSDQDVVSHSFLLP